MISETLQYTSAIAVGLAVFFILIVIEITGYKMAIGTIQLPAFLPRIDDFASFWNLFTAVPVLVSAYLCHFNGMLYNLFEFFFNFDIVAYFGRQWP